MSEEDIEKIDLSIFDETNLPEHQMKIAVGLGSFIGWRGNNEQVKMTKDMITSGYFPDDHPLFPGVEWWGPGHLNEDKCQKLGLHFTHVQIVKDFGKFPVLSDGKNGGVSKDIGGAIKRMYEKIPDSKMTNCWYRRVSKDGSSFLANQVLGKEKVRDYLGKHLKKWE